MFSVRLTVIELALTLWICAGLTASAIALTLRPPVEEMGGASDTTLNVRIIAHHSYDDVNVALKRLFPKLKDMTVYGFMFWRADGTCEIHMKSPSGASDTQAMRVWGHELMHCIYGQYHR